MKSEGINITDILLKIFNRSMESGVVPGDWKAACIIPIHKRKCDRKECANYRAISILSTTGKIYGKVLINRVIERTGSGEAKKIQVW